MLPEFTVKTRDALGKRAAYLCSNPDCRKNTSGPSDTAPDKAIILGEAAHIYGAAIGSARYRAEMQDEARANITNGIWLCRNCHKMADDDPVGYPAEMLFAWREEHNRYVVDTLGKSNDRLRLEIITRELHGLGAIPPLARTIVAEKPPGWEFRLTTELITFYMEPARQRWYELKSGYYSKRVKRLEEADFTAWFSAAVADVQVIISTVDKLCKAVTASWGEVGVPGVTRDIDRACMLLGQTATRMIDWEEDVAFVSPPGDYEEVHALLKGAIGDQIENIMSMRKTINDVVEWIDAGQIGTKCAEHVITMSLPEGWEKNMSAAFERLRRRRGI